MMNIQERLAASSLTFRDEPLDTALERLHRLGFTRLDLVAIRHYCDHFDPLLESVGDAMAQRVLQAIRQHGMQTVSLVTYPANPLAPDLFADDWAEGVNAYVRVGMVLGAQYLILPPGGPAPRPERWRGTVEHAKPWLRDAAQRVLNARLLPVLALQSNSILHTSQQGVDFLRILGVLNVGLAIDPAHLVAMGEHPAEAIRRMGNAIAFVVLRDTDGTDFNLPPGSGQLDYPSILTALEDIGYAGPLVLAADDVSLSPEEREDRLTRGWDYLARITQRKAA